MKCVVFLPGIMGSELRNSVSNKRVWPPKLSQIIRKNINVDDLLSPDLVATKPIEDVIRFYSVYRCILKDIQACGYEIEGAADRRFIPYAYDWRLPNQTTARNLAEHLSAQEAFDEIVLIGHSMGGLVLRYLLESGEFNNEPWFNQVTQLITLGTPHTGAAAALNQVAGLAHSTGMTAENVKKLVSDKRYPTAYQLVAPAGSAITLRSTLRGKIPETVDPFDDAIVQKYGLEPANIESSRQFWSKLDVKKRPAAVSYFSFVGSAHTTLFRLDWSGRELTGVEGKESGDGTVPVASALHVDIPHAFSEKKHATIFEDRSLRFALYKILGAPVSVVPHSAADAADVGAPNALGLSTDRTEYKLKDSIEVGVSYTQPQTNPTCVLQLLLLDQESEEGLIVEEVGDPIRVKFDGVDLQNFRFTMNVEFAETGVYELKAAGEVDDPERTVFVVAE